MLWFRKWSAESVWPGREGCERWKAGAARKTEQNPWDDGTVEVRGTDSRTSFLYQVVEGGSRFWWHILVGHRQTQMCSKERFQNIERFGTTPEGMFKGIKLFCQEKTRLRRISHLFLNSRSVIQEMLCLLCVVIIIANGQRDVPYAPCFTWLRPLPIFTTIPWSRHHCLLPPCSSWGASINWPNIPHS